MPVGANAVRFASNPPASETSGTPACCRFWGSRRRVRGDDLEHGVQVGSLGLIN